MKSSNNCKRVVLAGSDGCRVLFCEECNVAEVEVGALSLRLEAHAFHTLGELLQEATAKLAVFNAAKSRNAFRTRTENVH